MKKRHAIIDLGSVFDGGSSKVADLGSMESALFFIKTGSGSERSFIFEASPDGDAAKFGICGQFAKTQAASSSHVQPINWMWVNFQSYIASTLYCPRFVRVTSVSGTIDSVIVDAQRFIA